jgi:hypothetical protein
MVYRCRRFGKTCYLHYGPPEKVWVRFLYIWRNYRGIRPEILWQTIKTTWFSNLNLSQGHFQNRSLMLQSAVLLGNWYPKIVKAWWPHLQVSKRTMTIRPFHHWRRDHHHHVVSKSWHQSIIDAAAYQRRTCLYTAVVVLRKPEISQAICSVCS